MTDAGTGIPTSVVAAARRALGPVGVLLPVTTPVPTVDALRDGVRRLEAAGYRAAWVNEVVGGGKDAFVQLALLLSATQWMAFGTSIANIWARPPQTAHGAALLLAQAFPDRFVLGLGVGYPQQAASVGREFGSAVATMRDYLAQLAPERVPYPFIVGATGPSMLALAGEAADGALPIMVPPAYTARARQQLGPDKLLVVAVPLVADADPVRARATAKQTVAGLLSEPGTYPAMLAGLGYTQQDIGDVSDHLVDAVVGHGDTSISTAKVREHLDAGADHVMVMSSGTDFADGIAQLQQLAPALVPLTQGSRPLNSR